MSRRTQPYVAPTGQLDREAPIITKFEDGREVSDWMRVVRLGGTPGVDLLDQLRAAGWEHVAVAKVKEIVDTRKRQGIGYATISGILERRGCELEVEVTDIKGVTYGVALCRNEFSLLHGHTTNQRGPELRVLLWMSINPSTFGGMLLATR